MNVTSPGAESKTKTKNKRARLRFEDMLLMIDLNKEVGIHWFQLPKAWKVLAATPFDWSQNSTRPLYKLASPTYSSTLPTIYYIGCKNCHHWTEIY